MPRLTRRRLLASALAAVPIGVGLYAWRIEPEWLEITRRPLPIDGLPEGMDGRTLAHLSDLHVGPFVDDGYIIDTFRRVQALDPDFVVVTGDWITYAGPAQLDQLRRVLESMPHGRLATVGVLGNHDYGPDWQRGDVGDAVARITGNAGVQLLRNEALEVNGFWFLGLDDLWGPRFDPVPLLTSYSNTLGAIVLCHNPDAADRPVWTAFKGWILAGHTHGGQVKPPFLPPPWLPVSNPRYVAGEVGLEDGRRLYISRGVGHLERVRFNVRPEVTLFRLTRTGTRPGIEA